jgi:hypothetical protein
MTSTLVGGLGPLSAAEQARYGELLATVKRGLETALEVARSLEEIRARKLYRDRYSSWDAFCRAECGFTGGRGYRLVGLAEVAQLLPTGTILTERAARELRPLVNEPAKLKLAYDRAAAQGRPTSTTIGVEVEQLTAEQRLANRPDGYAVLARLTHPAWDAWLAARGHLLSDAPIEEGWTPQQRQAILRDTAAMIERLREIEAAARNSDLRAVGGNRA